MVIDTDPLSPSLELVRIHDTLWEMRDVFSKDYLDYIDTFLDRGHNWFMDRRLSRLSLPADTLDQPFESAGIALAQKISQVIGETLCLRHAKLLLDLPGNHGVPTHVDDPSILVMCQVYLTGSLRPLPGTTFLDPRQHTIQYQVNHGYININTDAKRHNSLPTTDLRCSMALQFHRAK